MQPEVSVLLFIQEILCASILSDIFIFSLHLSISNYKYIFYSVFLSDFLSWNNPYPLKVFVYKLLFVCLFTFISVSTSKIMYLCDTDFSHFLYLS